MLAINNNKIILPELYFVLSPSHALAHLMNSFLTLSDLD